MKILLSLLTVLTALLLLPLHAFAANPAPLQLSPLAGQTVSTTKLEWLVPTYTLKSTSPYRVQVSSSLDFTSPAKDTTTSNTFYSPQLTEGIWYWRILAKDAGSIDSDWSQTQRFTYSTIIPSPSPSPSPSPLPSLSPTPEPQIVSNPTPTVTPTPTVNPTIQPSPTPTPTPSPSFNIGQTPSPIDSTQSFQNYINLILPQYPNTIFYLKGAFFEDGSSNYFGQTKYSGNWIKNSQTYSSQYKIQTDNQGKWQGYIEFIPDPQDSGFGSSGDYNFKVGRYTSTGAGPTWSESQTIYINEVISPSPSPSTTPSVSTLPISSLQPSPTSLNILDSQPEIASLAAEEIEATESAMNIDPQIATIEGIATVAGEMKSKSVAPQESKINPNWFYLSSGLLFLASLASLIIVKYKPHLKIKQWLSLQKQPPKPNNLPPLWQKNLNPRVE